MKEKQQEVRLVYTGVRNLFLRIVTAPLSFIFTYLVAKYLSSLPNGEVIFASWQSLYVLVLGYFTIPADVFSTLTSRYASENKPVGGIILFNFITGAISSLIYISLVPYLSNALGYRDYFAFYLAAVMILIFYIYRVSLAIARGRTPLVIGVSTMAFQVIRLLTVIVAFYVFHFTISGVIYAYVAGYLVQLTVNLFHINSNLKLDIKVALNIVKKSVVTIISYLQLIIEATIVWITIILIHNDIPVAYFESALIVSNVVTWSYSLYDGLIAKLSESKDPSIITTSLNLYFFISSLWLTVVITEGHALLFHIRREYLEAIYALMILSISNYLRGLYSIFYYAIVMKDKLLGVDEMENPFKGITAKLNLTNIRFSVIGVLGSALLVYLFRNYPPYIIAVSMSIGPLVNSIWLAKTSYSIAKSEYKFSVPKKESLTSVLIMSALSLVFYNLNFTSYLDIVIYGLIVTILFTAISYFVNPYAKIFIKSLLKELRKFLM